MFWIVMRSASLVTCNASNRGRGKIPAPVGKISAPVGKISAPIGKISAPIGKIRAPYR